MCTSAMTITAAPSAAKPRVHARPSLRRPPVTRRTLTVRCMILRPCEYSCRRQSCQNEQTMRALRTRDTCRAGDVSGVKTGAKARVHAVTIRGGSGLSTPTSPSSRRWSGDAEPLHFVEQGGAFDSQAGGGALGAPDHPLVMVQCLLNSNCPFAPGLAPESAVAAIGTFPAFP